MLNYISLKKKKMSRVMVLTWVGEREHSIHIRVTGEIFQNTRLPPVAMYIRMGKRMGEMGSPHFFKHSR